MAATLVERLKEEWHADLGAWGASPAHLEAAFGQLVTSYQEPRRTYHTLDHVAVVLRTTDGLAADTGATDTAPIRLAAWYHDVVYDPRSHDNEARSAVLAAADMVSLSVPGDIVQECVRLIGLTAHHQAARGDTNGAVLLDADLAVLASSPERYDRYASGIRAEHAHLDDAAYVSGRAVVLQGLLDRPFVFSTAPFRTEREPRARANLERELAALRTT
jgi:predicted metal-dependent HD superfamily phosphohydrolase